MLAYPRLQRTRASAAAALGVVLALALSACSGEADAPAAVDASVAAEAPAAAAAEASLSAEPVQFADAGSLEAVALELGTALDADGRVRATTERVRPSDTVHVSLVTVGDATAATLIAHWRDASGVGLASDQRQIVASGPAVHTFSHTPATPWPPGRYEVELVLAGESAGVRAFEVR